MSLDLERVLKSEPKPSVSLVASRSPVAHPRLGRTHGLDAPPADGEEHIFHPTAVTGRTEETPPQGIGTSV